jgi:tRNA modification GTPase
MDLTQAEAVIDLIRARSDLALRSATEQLEGRLGAKIVNIRQALIDLLAHIEASIDFSEEGISPDDDLKLRARLDSIREQISTLLRTADQGRILRDGVRVVIYGATNAGKSSLLNRLLGYERVIVSETHGTTRDTIEEAVNFRGIPIRLLDTAGLRTSTSDIEREGIARTEHWLQKADLRLHVVDRNVSPPAHFEESNVNGNDLLVLNKGDLSEHAAWRNISAVRISCLTGEGLTELENAILSRISDANLRPENALAINIRHCNCLRRALGACDRARKTLDETPSPEFLSVDLNDALAAVGEVIGTVGVEEILDSIFGQFCIGK